jgi:hypothetical protein
MVGRNNLKYIKDITFDEQRRSKLEEKLPVVHRVHHTTIFHVSETLNTYNHSALNNFAINPS